MPHAAIPGARIGDFTIVRHLANGGMGAVYVARQESTGALRALKLLHPFLGSDGRLQARFEQEARVGALIPSGHVVEVVDAGIDSGTGTAWLAMELLEGMSLAQYVSSRVRLDAPEVFEILSQVAHALSAAHGVRVVHRDLKPENVFLATRRMVGVPYVVKLLDFGIAKLVSESTGGTAAIGTPAYMAPEQAHGSALVSPATDIWAFGLLAFEMLTGFSFWRSVDSGSAAELLREVLIDELPTATERADEELLEPAIPSGFDAWFARCVARSPEDRFPSIDAALEALRPLLGESQATARSHVSLPTGGRGPARTATPMDTTLPHADSGAPSLGMGRPSSRRALRVVYRERFGKTIVPAAGGQSILEVSIENELPHQRVCGGKGRCTTCRVYVYEGANLLTARTEVEEKVATKRAWAPEIRLACQARLRPDARGELSVRRLVVDRQDAEVAQTQTGQETELVERHALVLVARLEGLASFASRHLAYDAMHVTCRAFRSLADLVRSHRGEVLGFNGTRMTACFGSRAAELPQATLEGARAAARMKARMATVNEYVGRNFGEAFSIAIGLHTGIVFTGKIIDGDFRAPAALGEPIDVAARVAERAASTGVALAATAGAVESIRDSLVLGESIGLVEIGAAAMDVHPIVDFTKADVNFLVQSTFESVLAGGDEFARRFYDRLFAVGPEVVPLFDDVDMDVQPKMLMDALTLAVRSLDDVKAVTPVLQQLGQRHAGYGVEVRHYRLVGDSLMWTLEQFLGERFTPEVHVAWMEVYGTIARIMIEAARPSVSAA
jgi:serine/threonine protein kinase/hemoglobin-like flavoprotein/ferredoxin